MHQEPSNGQNIRRQALWESLGLSLAASLVVGAGILGLWTTSTGAIRENYQHYLIGLAETAATLIDTDLHESIRRPDQLDDPDYRRAVEPLRRMRNAVKDVHYVFTVIRDGSRIRFVLDSGNVGDQAGVLEIYDGRHPALWKAPSGSTLMRGCTWRVSLRPAIGRCSV